MRRKMAKAVEGCWYRRLKVVPGSLSRYSKEAREETDIVIMVWASIRCLLPVDHGDENVWGRCLKEIEIALHQS